MVELDPVVHQFASQYFQLPSNHTAVIEDAVTYTSRTAANGRPDGRPGARGSIPVCPHLASSSTPRR